MARKASPKSSNARGVNAGKETVKDLDKDPEASAASQDAASAVTPAEPAGTQSGATKPNKKIAAGAKTPSAPVARGARSQAAPAAKPVPKSASEPASGQARSARAATRSSKADQAETAPASTASKGTGSKEAGARKDFQLADRDQSVATIAATGSPAAQPPKTEAKAPPVVESQKSPQPLGPIVESTPQSTPQSTSEPASNPSPASEPLSAPPAQRQPEPEPIPEPEKPEPYYPPRQSLFIVHITPEMAPVAKVGGLADVVFGLSRELAIRGNHVEIILPKYDNLRYDHIFELHRVFDDLWVPWYEGAIHCTVYFGFVHSRKCFFIEPHSSDNFFNRGSIYGFNDDILRYAFFSRAAIEFLWQSGKHPDIIHCHDWQTALVPVYLYEFYQQLGMMHPRACLTIHNFKHQGVTGAELLRASGLHRPEHFFDRLRLGDDHYPNALNMLKGGVVYSNFVTTVSPRYAFETKDQGQGFGLESILHSHHMKYGGVVNGIDYDVWNPEVDPHIPVRYGIETLDGKYDNKRALRHRLMLADNEKPIVAFIGRLDPQKGLELVRHAIFYALERGAQFVLLGSSPDHAINNDFWGLKHMLNDSPDCHLEIGFDEELAHLIYAGADMMLVPSQFEPCGLTQLISLRYGTIPVVRAVGGLADTVFDKDHSDRPLHERNGYSFDNYDTLGLESAFGRALACYYGFPEHFRDLIKNAMRSDYSWNRPGQDYLNIYDFIRNH
ncbi:glycogen synthase [Thiorhodovibrio frisius]|uniref:Glycogen synthase n=1 Tax=Thiorhodovibrio frisius TaxID=631362 RepID=H8Z6W0_9GAMM|nr:glycogen synthase [Thiorhodovibrio frisius]EIC19745.1 glycogen/starch synthase, ADP-glucose type [Thiorhodovibrio frisius]WPL20287.1 putative glycogen synthase 2 [Thiorhodovibrio frisius]